MNELPNAMASGNVSALLREHAVASDADSGRVLLEAVLPPTDDERGTWGGEEWRGRRSRGRRGDILRVCGGGSSV